MVQLVSYMVFNPFKMAVQFFSTASKIPISMAQINFSQIQLAPGPDSRKVGKSLEITFDIIFRLLVC